MQSKSIAVQAQKLVSDHLAAYGYYGEKCGFLDQLASSWQVKLGTKQVVLLLYAILAVKVSFTQSDIILFTPPKIHTLKWMNVVICSLMSCSRVLSHVVHLKLELKPLLSISPTEPLGQNTTPKTLYLRLLLLCLQFGKKMPTCLQTIATVCQQPKQSQGFWCKTIYLFPSSHRVKLITISTKCFLPF